MPRSCRARQIAGAVVVRSVGEEREGNGFFRVHVDAEWEARATVACGNNEVICDISVALWTPPPEAMRSH